MSPKPVHTLTQTLTFDLTVEGLKSFALRDEVTADCGQNPGWILGSGARAAEPS